MMAENKERPGTLPGPGVVLSEAAQGLRNKVARGELTALEGQELYDACQRTIVEAVRKCPGFPWDADTTELDLLQEEARRLHGGRVFN